MYLKPKGFNRVGIIQCFLAAFFVLWFLIFPQYGKYFAWPVVPELTALFLGAGFMLRSYFGYHLWRDKYWYSVRWSMNGDFAFLGTLFIATWWHINEMNWDVQGVSNSLRIFCLVIVHVWVFAYTFEPLVVFLLYPREKEAHDPVPAEYSEGEIQPGTKTLLAAIFLFGAAFWALLFFTPDFASSRWPWELNAFDSRIMSAWFAGSSVWSVTMYFMKDWAEIKVGVRALLFFLLGLLAVWTITSPRYRLTHTEIATRQGIVFGVALGVVCAWLLFVYWKQEQARKALQKVDRAEQAPAH
jgi:membrane protein CcdC involved in cytochrome C biogenesis